MGSPRYARDREFAIDLATQAGELIRSSFILGMQRTFKSDNSPLTETDLKINTLVADAVERRYPTYGLLAEEGQSRATSAPHVWVCDPIDGTVPFSHGVPTCAFSLALVHEGTPVLGVIYDALFDRMFVAESGAGATANGAPITVSRERGLRTAVVGVEWWEQGRYDLLAILGPLNDRQATSVRLASIAYMGALVAGGEFAAALYGGIQPWDGAAVKVIVDEAGGKVTDVFGGSQRYDREIRGVIASNGALHSELVDIVAPFLSAESSSTDGTL